MTAVTRAGDRLVCVGERGSVLLSDDAGAHWHQAASVPVSAGLTAVRFLTPSEGWAVGHEGVVLRSSDAGEHWLLQMDGLRAAALTLKAAQAMPDGPPRGAAIRSASLLVSDGADKPFLDVQTVMPHTILAVGAYGLAVKSSDGGVTWKSAVADFADPKGLHIYHLANNGEVAFAAGEQGLFLTSRSGSRYESDGIKHSGTFFGMIAVGRQTFLAYGLAGAVFRTTDNGAHWLKIEAGVQSGLTSAAVLDDGDVVMGAISGQIVISHDGGRHFVPTAFRLDGPVSGMVQSGSVLILAGRDGPKRVDKARLQEAS